MFKIARKSGHADLVLLFDPDMGPALLLFHHTLQRMLVFAGKVHDLCDLGLGHLVGVDTALADSVLVYMHHDAGRLLPALVEEPFHDAAACTDFAQ